MVSDYPWLGLSEKRLLSQCSTLQRRSSISNSNSTTLRSKPTSPVTSRTNQIPPAKPLTRPSLTAPPSLLPPANSKIQLPVEPTLSAPNEYPNKIQRPRLIRNSNQHSPPLLPAFESNPFNPLLLIPFHHIIVSFSFKPQYFSALRSPDFAVGIRKHFVFLPLILGSSMASVRRSTTSSLAKRHASASESIGKAASSAAAAKKRPALANVTNQRHGSGSFNSGRIPAPESSKIVRVA